MVEQRQLQYDDKIVTFILEQKQALPTIKNNINPTDFAIETIIHSGKDNK